jgi:hypothetical protein
MCGVAAFSDHRLAIPHRLESRSRTKNSIRRRLHWWWRSPLVGWELAPFLPSLPLSSPLKYLGLEPAVVDPVARRVDRNFVTLNGREIVGAKATLFQIETALDH